MGHRATSRSVRDAASGSGSGPTSPLLFDRNSNRNTGVRGAPAPADDADDVEIAFDFEGFMDKLGEQLVASNQKLMESIGDTLSEGVKAALVNIHDPQKDGPQPVRAARYTVTREEPVYTFNGSGPCLVRDAWHAHFARDDQAIDRIRKFTRQNEDMSRVAHSALQFSMTQAAARFGQHFTPSSTSNAAAIIPPGYRPDLFVPQLMQQRPFANALSQGVISNATPFVVPVFGSITGGTADHVEGTNPTDGTLAFTTKTVTPGAISGLLKLTREIVDSSNPAIDQIALAAMRESYARQTETKIYTLLNGASGQGGVMAPAPSPTAGGDGFVPSGAQVSSVGTTDLTGKGLILRERARIALYPFNRFAAPNRALLSQRATTAFATAVDSTGRPLLPSVGAQNTAGIGNAVEVGWFVDGLAHVPAWAITGTADGDGDVFILNSMDAWVWESPTLLFRYEERSGPAHIDLALFGYFATHLLRPVGLAAVRFSDGIT